MIMFRVPQKVFPRLRDPVLNEGEFTEPWIKLFESENKGRLHDDMGILVIFKNCTNNMIFL